MITSNTISVCAALGLSFALGCQDNTPIGAIECVGEHIRCGVPEPSRPEQDPLGLASDIVSSVDLDVLQPAYSGTPFGEVPNVGFVLVADANGELWNAHTSEKQIVFSKLDREGASLEEHAFNPPRGTMKPERYHPTVLGLATGVSAMSTPSFAVAWSRSCDGRDFDSQDCQLEEIMSFDDYAREPRRTSLFQISSGFVQANESGMWSIRREYIDKYDRRGNLVWRQTGELKRQYPDSDWDVRAELLPDDQMSVFVWGIQGGIALGGQLLRLDAFGNIVKQRRVSWIGSYVVQSAVDSRGRHLLMGATSDSDMFIMRIAPDETVDGIVIQRDEYTALFPDVFAVDSDDAVYVVSKAGPRDELRAILCQLTARGSTRCFTLGGITSPDNIPRQLVDDLVVPEPGVVYARSGSTLRRYELPAQ